MATDTVLISHVTGKAWMRASDGTMIALHEGMRVPVNAHIMTDEGASVTLQATGVPPVIVGQNTDMLVSEDLAAAQPQPADNAVTPPADPVADQILAALDAGQDPFAILDPTAAVLTGGGGGGDSFTRLASITETTTPLALAYPRLGVETPEIVQLGGVAATADDAGIAPPDNGVTVTVPPPQPPEQGEGGDLPVYGWPEDYTVYESGLPGGSNTDSSATVIFSSFTIQAPDGLNTVTLGYTDASGVSVTKTLSAAQLIDLGSTPQTIDTQYGTMTLWGYSQAADGTITIEYGYDLTKAPAVPGDQSSETITITATDVDGDSSGPQPLNITIVDDAPTAHLDVDSIAAGGTTAAGNVITGAGTEGGVANADVQGADGAHVSAIKSEYSSASTSTPDGSGNLVINGQYGVLTIGADGEYSYVRNPGTAGGVSDVFTYTLSDGDTDTDTATLTINIGNSVPTLGDIPAAGEAGAVVSEAGLPARGSEPAGSHAGDGSATTSGTIAFTSLDGLGGVSLGGQPVSSTDSASPTDLGNGLSAYYTYDVATGAGTIHYTYTLPDNTSGDDTSVSFDVQVSDADGQSSGTGHLVIDIVDDAPTAHLDVDSIAAGGTAAAGNVITGAGTEGGVANADVQGADGAHVSAIASDNVSGNTATTVGGNLVINGQYGVLTIGADGEYSYVRNPGTAGGVSDVFTYTLSDGDTDTDTATLTINIGNDVPTIGTIPAAGGEDTQVYEAGLPARSGEPAGSDASKSTVADGTIGFTAKDGVGSVSLGGHDLSGDAAHPTEFADGTRGTVSAYYTYDAATGAGTIHYTYTLVDNTGDDTSVTYAVVVTDADGQGSGTGHDLVINIVDDAPTAHLDVDSIAAGGTTAAGNVITGVGTEGGVANADVQGADGAHVSAIKSEYSSASTSTPDGSGNLVINGRYGVLTIGADGEYSYVRNPGTAGGVSDVFTYTLSDGDTDTDTATLTINIGNDVPTIGTIPAAGGEDTQVYEAGLPARSGEPAGSDASKSTVADGTIGFTAKDGVGSVSLGGHDLSGDAAHPTEFADGTRGTVSAYYTYDAATGAGTIHYTYTLVDNTGDDTSVTYAVVVTDADGQGSGTGHDLVINIVDDAPTAHLDVDSIAAGGTTAAGNVITGAGTEGGVANADVQGADGAHVSAIKSEYSSASTSTPDGSGNLVINGQYGVLTIGADGEYSYVRNPGTAGGVSDVFTYTLSDGDTDTDTATLTINIGNSVPTLGDIPAAGEAGAVVSEAGLPARGSEPAGSHAGDGSATTSGTIAFTSLDGLGGVSLGGQPVSSTDSASPTDLGNGLSAYYTYDVATGAGTIHYTYTLPDNTSGDDTSVSFDVQVSDADGQSSGTGHLVIDIVDDAPTAHLDVDSIAAGGTAAAGNVITGAGTEGGVANADVQGADGAHVSAIKSEYSSASTSTPDGSGNLVINGQYGVLTIGADGEYSYVRNPGTAGGVSDVFTYTLSDGDTDTDTATLTINIGNSVPTLGDIPAAGEAGAVVSEAGLPARGSEPAGSHAGDGSATTSGTIAFTSLDGLGGVSLGGQPVSSTDSASPTDLGNGLSAYYTYDVATGAGTIHYTYTLPDNTSGDDTSVSFDVQVSDADGQSSGTGHLVIDIVDDAPTAHLDVDSIAAGGTAAAGNVITGAGTEGGVANADVQGADGAHVSAIKSEYSSASTSTPDGSGNLVINGQYGVLTIGADGEYSYVRNPGTAGGVSDVFTYTLSDGDTDTDTATLTINIGNSVPTLGDIPAAGEAGAVVSEAGLPARGSEPAGSHAGDGSATTSGTIAFTSLDGLGGVSLGGQPVSSTDSASPTDLGNGLSAYYTYDVATGAGTIHYTYTLPDNTSGDDTSVSFDVQVSDADGQSSGTGHLVIDIVDDAPTAHLDVDSIAAGGTAAAGNVITGAGTEGGVANADVQGADGAHVSAIASDNVSGNTATTVGGNLVINGQYGVLTIGADGEYSYVRNPGTAGGVSDVFTYTLSDGDTDTDTATLTINIGNDVPTIGTIPAAGGEDTQVYEAGLPARSGEPAGSDASKSTVADGTIGFTAKDGVGSVSLGGHDLSGDAAHPTEFADGTRGTVSAYYTYDAATGAGTIHYTYTLVDNTGDDTSVTYAVVVTDADGQGSGAGHDLVINIMDDVPHAVADTNSVTEGGQAVGNVLTDGADDVFGADGKDAGGGVVGVRAAAGDTTTAVTTGVNTVIHGQYGDLTLQADGSYTYAAHTVTQDETDTFVYTIRDGDGDLSTTTLVINVTDKTPESNGGAITEAEDTPHIFTWADFNITNADTNPGVKITHLPSEGVLQYSSDGTVWFNVSAGQTIDKSVIDAEHLRFVPEPNESGTDGYGGSGVGDQQSDYAQITFQPVGGGETGSEATLSIDITPVADAPALHFTIGQPVTVGGGASFTMSYDNGSRSITVADGLMTYSGFTKQSDSNGTDNGRDLFVFDGDISSNQTVNGGTRSYNNNRTDVAYFGKEYDAYTVTKTGGDWNVKDDATGYTVTVKEMEGIVFADGIYEGAGSISGLSVPDAYHTYDVDLHAALSDTDGSESLSGVTVTGLPDGAKFTVDGTPDGALVGHAGSSGTWVFPSSLAGSDGNYDLGNLHLVVSGSGTPPTLNLTATVDSVESVGGDHATANATATTDHYTATAGGEGDDTLPNPPSSGNSLDLLMGDPGGAHTVVTPGQSYNIALIVDTSGSMSNSIDGTTRMQLAKDALKNLADQLAGHDGTVNVALIGFSGDAQDAISFTFNPNDPDTVTLANLKAAIDALYADGGTNYSSAFQEAVDWFGTQPTTGYQNLTYFLTDGDPTISASDDNGGNTTAVIMQESIAAFDSLSDVSQVHGIGIGSGVSENYLQFFDNTPNAGGSIDTTSVTFASTTTLANFNSGDGWSDTEGWGTSGSGSVDRINNSGSSNDYLRIRDTNDSSVNPSNPDSGSYKVDTPDITVAAGQTSTFSFDFQSSNFNSADTFRWVLQKKVGSGWTDVESGTHGSYSNSWDTITTTTPVGEGTYQIVFVLNDHSSNGTMEVRIDNINQTTTTVVEGPAGDVLVVQDAEQLAAALSHGSSNTTPAGYGSDTLNGGDGNDILFGDALDTSGLPWGQDGHPAQPSDLDDMTGLDALKLFLTQDGVAPTNEALVQYITDHHALFDVATDTQGGDDTLNGGKGNDILFGQGGSDHLYGSQGEDILYGGAGDDHLYGGAGSDTLIGGAGNDTFVWQLHDQWENGGANSGNAPIPVDHVVDFSGGDKLDLSDLLQGEEHHVTGDGSGHVLSGDLTQYLHISVEDGNTVINVSSHGTLNAAGNGYDQQIVIDNVDLTAGHSGDQAALINSLINDGKLKVDQG